jgi:hypothetical protein
MDADDNPGALCPELEILRCGIRTTVTKSTVLTFLNAKTFPHHQDLSFDGSSPKPYRRKPKFQELSLAGLQFDGPFCPGISGEIQYDDWKDSDWDIDGDEDDIATLEQIRLIREAGVRLSFSRCEHYGPSSNKDPGWLGYATDFGY